MNIFQKFACHRSGAFTSGKKLWKNLWENYKQDRVSSSLPRSRFLDVTQRSPKRGKRGVGGGGGWRCVTSKKLLRGRVGE